MMYENNVPIEAHQLTPDTAKWLAAWCDGVLVTEIDPLDESKTFVGINVHGYLDVERASEGDYITHDLDKGFRVVKKHEFERTHRPKD